MSCFVDSAHLIIWMCVYSAYRYMTQLRNGNDTQYMVIKVERADFINCNKVSKRISLKLYKEPGGHWSEGY